MVFGVALNLPLPSVCKVGQISATAEGVMSCVENVLPCVTMGPFDLMLRWLCIHMAF